MAAGLTMLVNYLWVSTALMSFNQRRKVAKLRWDVAQSLPCVPPDCQDGNVTFSVKLLGR